MKRIFCIGLMLGLAACVHLPDRTQMNAIELGMTKHEIRARLGEPLIVTKVPGQEMWRYDFVMGPYQIRGYNLLFDAQHRVVSMTPVDGVYVTTPRVQIRP